MALKYQSVLGIWHQSNKKQKVFLACLILLLLYLMGGVLTSGLALIGITVSYLISFLNTSAGFMVAQSAIPMIINRFNKKNSTEARGREKLFVPKRMDASDGTRAVVLDQATKYLQSLIGLEDVKDQISKYKALVMITKRRGEINKEDNPSNSTNLNLVFLGSPGTGKTTVARIWGDLLFGLGLLNSGHTLEVDRSTLVGKYVGQTAQLTLEACIAAIDGVLFIDEAYALSRPESDNDFGHEAIETIMKFMEDNRGRISVIVAGYERQMEAFLLSNPGLKSRFPRRILFNDFTPEQLRQIFEQYSVEDHMALPSDSKDFLNSLFKKIAASSVDFGNARFVRNFYESCKENHAFRLESSGSYAEKDLNSFELCDFTNSIKVEP